ncbi:MAG: hypothetical protein K940chlam2_01177 [Chlamydiae bacterium]|nr:hypothetical protein [Chlamydiota bacterium]
MKLFRMLINLLLLVITPTFLLTPHTKLLATEHVPFGIASHRALNSENNLLFSYDELMALIDDLESDRAPEDYSAEEIEAINRYLAGLALEGTLPGESTALLEQDIVTLLSPFEYAPPYYDRAYALMAPGELTLCKGWLSESWDKTKTFVKEHKKEIIIGVAIVVAVTIVVIIVAASAGTAAAAGAAGAAAVLSEHDKAPSLEKTIDEKIYSFKELASEEVVLESIDYQNDPSAKTTFKDLGALLAHETLDGISEVSSMIPRMGEEIKELASHMLPNGILPPENNELFWNADKHEERYAKGHEIIDQAFSTNQAPLYTPEGKENRLVNTFTQPLLPPPGGLPQGVSVSKFRQIATAGRETAALADELGFTAKEITHLEKSGTLKRTVADAVDKIYSNQKMAESYERFKNAKAALEPFAGKYMPEIEAQRLIQQNGIRAFPRPKGIPENWHVKLSDKGAGIKYVHPDNEQTYVRVMPGKPHSKYSHQQKPYVVQMKNGKTIDKSGRAVHKAAPEAHLALEEYVYTGE